MAKEPVKLICVYCNKEFTVPPSQRNSRKCCSRSCASRLREQLKRPQKPNNSPWRNSKSHKIGNTVFEEISVKATKKRKDDESIIQEMPIETTERKKSPFVNTGDDFTRQFIGKVYEI